MSIDSIFPATRVGEMFSSIAGGLKDDTPEAELNERKNSAMRLMWAAMGADYMALCVATRARPASEALNHWLEFCVLVCPELFGTKEKLEAYRPILRAVLKDMQDIQSGKIS